MTPNNIPAVAWGAIKILSIIGFIVYAIFAAIMVRQEQLMASSLKETFEPVLRLLTLIHLIAALLVIGLAIILL